MSTNIAIDLGNSSAKLYIFDGNALSHSYRYDEVEEQHIKDVFARHSIDNAIVSSVQRDSSRISALIHSLTPGLFIDLSHTTPMPMTIEYGTPHTLGRDRIAVAVGALTQNPGQNIVVIDTGTAMTLDVVSAEGAFLGGNIAPGLSTRFRALNQYTDCLPLIDADGATPLIGDSTANAMRSGVVRGMAHEINGFIADVSDKMPHLVAYITGGDAKYLAKWIKYRIFEDENLLAKGLNTILLYNLR